jgi:hypothetical protein
MEKSLDPNVPEHQGWIPFSRAAARQGDVKTVMAARLTRYPSECGQRTTATVVSCKARPYPSGSAVA